MRVWLEMKGGKTKILKRGGQAGSSSRCLKKRGAGTPSRTMVVDKYVQ